MKKRFILAFVASTAIGGVIGGLLVARHIDTTVAANAYNADIPAQKVNLTGTANAVDFTAAVAQSVDAVVHVKTSYTRIVQSAPDLFDYFFGFRDYHVEQTPKMGVGSGVIISKDGYIVTNNHVIDKAQDIQVTLDDKRTFAATLVGADPGTDIAVLKIEGKDFSYLNFGSSDELKLGEWVLAIGNPLNLTSTVTAGIVSAKARNINILSENFKIESFIQTDAAVNPGNSGGALINTRGELVGINTAIASPTGTFTGYSFAVPSSIAKKVVADIIEFGVVQRAVLGVQLAELTSDVAKSVGIQQVKGVLVAEVIPNSAAEAAGVKKNDVITKVNDVEVSSAAQLQEQLSKFRPNDQISLTINRNNKTTYVNVVLRNKEGTTRIVAKKDITANALLGATFGVPDANTMRQLRIANGVQVTNLGSGILKTQGIQKGYIIVRMNHIAVNSVQDIDKILQQAQGDAILVEGIYPNGMRAYYAFPVK
ncbi:serine protease [Bacteroidia bacterium]|nr:serine protease [Bacteroidia bacterium]